MCAVCVWKIHIGKTLFYEYFYLFVNEIELLFKIKTKSGWNLRKNTCEDATKASANLVPLNQNLCSRLERQENIKSIQLESGAFAVLECNLNDNYLYEYVEWRKDQKAIDFSQISSQNMFLTWNKGFHCV